MSLTLCSPQEGDNRLINASRGLINSAWPQKVSVEETCWSVICVMFLILIQFLVYKAFLGELGGIIFLNSFGMLLMRSIISRICKKLKIFLKFKWNTFHAHNIFVWYNGINAKKFSLAKDLVRLECKSWTKTLQQLSRKNQSQMRVFHLLFGVQFDAGDFTIFPQVGFVRQ